jgi:hypothetical protein
MEDNTVRLETLSSGGVLTKIGGFTGQVYAWMTYGLFMTAAVAFITNFLFETSPMFRIWLIQNSWVITAAFFLQLILVIALSFGIEKFNTVVSVLMFSAYSILMGFTLFGILAQYTTASVFIAFAVTGGTFMVMSVIGFVTKTDLTRIGGIAIMGLIGVIIGTVVNIFLQSSAMDMVLTYAGIFIFLILIAYDSQKIRRFAAIAEQSGHTTRYAIIGALNLYLDFINLFLRILSITGKRK